MLRSTIHVTDCAPWRKYASLPNFFDPAPRSGCHPGSNPPDGGSLAAAPETSTSTEIRSVPDPPQILYLYHPTFLHNQYNYQSALYVQDPGAVPATVQLTFYRATASPITLSATVQPGATLDYARGQVPGLPNGLYWLEIASDQPLASVVEIYRTTGDRLAAYRGMTAPTGASAVGPSAPLYRSCSARSSTPAG